MERLRRLGQIGTEYSWFIRGALRKDYERLKLRKIDTPSEIFITQGRELSPPKERITLVSWNIQRGYQHDRLLSALSQLDFDILMLQESPITSKGIFSVNLAEEREDWSVFCPSIINNGFWKKDFSCFGQATLSKYPIRTYEIIGLPNVYDWEGMSGGKASCFKYALYAQVDLEGEKLGIYNLHLENFTTPQGRHYQILPVLEHVERMADEKVVIGGDFNIYLGRREGAVRVLEEVGFEYLAKDTRPFLDLDHFFVRGIPPTSATVLRAITGSDHKPLEIQVSLNS